MTPEFDRLESTLLRGFAREMDADGWQVTCERDAGDIVRIEERQIELYDDGDIYYVLRDGKVLADTEEYGAAVGLIYHVMEVYALREYEPPGGD